MNDDAIIAPDVLDGPAPPDEGAIALLALVGIATLNGSFPPTLAPMVVQALGGKGDDAVAAQCRRAGLPPAMIMMIRGPQG